MLEPTWDLLRQREDQSSLGRGSAKLSEGEIFICVSRGWFVEGFENKINNQLVLTDH